jgi:hypothetical protein
VHPAVAVEGEELDELRRLSAYPGVGRHGDVVASDREAAEKPHLNAHRGTLRLPADPSRGVSEATNGDPMLSGGEAAAGRNEEVTGDEDGELLRMSGAPRPTTLG